MDGYQFQEFVANLFKQLGFSNVKLGPRGADMGIDITMEQKSSVGITNRYLVECKHHPESAIGRPVVQKLHSAVVSTPALDKGIIVTSGHFSNEAVRYAEEVGIELIDGEKLKQLARKGGLTIITGALSLVENCFPVSSKTKIEEKLLGFLRDDLKGFDENLAKISDTSLVLISAYIVDYSINATFSTSAGIIHSINESSSIFLAGDSGRPIDPIITSQLLPFTSSISEISQQGLKDTQIKRIDFLKTHKEIEEPTKDFLARIYTRKVSYYGANNVKYTKVCVPNKRDIILHDIKKVYIPLWRVVFSIIKNKYAVVGLDTPSQLHILPRHLVSVPAESDVKLYPDECMICFKKIQQQKFVCNDCGRITCNKDGFLCKMCGKIVCREHVILKKKFLVLSEKYCSHCASKLT